MVTNYSEDGLIAIVEETISELESIKEKNQENHVRCPYHFGYLAQIPNHSLIPEECLLCSRVVKCTLCLEESSVDHNES